MKTDRYKGHVIDPRFSPLRAGGYNAWGMIRTHHGGEVILQGELEGEFQVSGTFNTEVEAIAASLAKGREIIDQRLNSAKMLNEV